MAKVYANQIKRGAIVLSDVPKKWREAVEKLV